MVYEEATIQVAKDVRFFCITSADYYNYLTVGEIIHFKQNNYPDSVYFSIHLRSYVRASVGTKIL